MADAEADRCGYRHLAAPHYGVEFKIYARQRWTWLEEPDLSVEYRGPDAELIAAGIVTAEFLVPCPGRPRRDAAGRRVKLERRLGGIRVVTFYRDPFAAPRLPAITQDLVDEAIEHERRYRREQRQLHEEEAKPGPLAPETYLDAAAVPLDSLSRIASYFCDRSADDLAGRLGEHIGGIKALLQMERERLARLKAARPTYLRLVIDNEARP